LSGGKKRLENRVFLGFVEGLDNKIRVLQRRAYGLRDEQYLRLKAKIVSRQRYLDAEGASQHGQRPAGVTRLQLFLAKK
jgi:hypothetical protein